LLANFADLCQEAIHFLVNCRRLGYDQQAGLQWPDIRVLVGAPGPGVGRHAGTDGANERVHRLLVRVVDQTLHIVNAGNKTTIGRFIRGDHQHFVADGPRKTERLEHNPQRGSQRNVMKVLRNRRIGADTRLFKRGRIQLDWDSILILQLHQYVIQWLVSKIDSH
jgi:hypothetical protein